ncbi:hypothetical protein GPECTOR_62g922 [Gonium pectorale]|uniref:CHY-type domain-containing protein n=1 Tax=Gonium pectorale TaxID=33097 RepID=A0A150G4M6_GONPE|nr:hypothetical protein GPECTOR_62g922 [Gonium pectorale]|eukprot:KXZ44807.1 hypothetical protein GPECTOR_62g922 [Gonium pectorale]
MATGAQLDREQLVALQVRFGVALKELTYISKRYSQVFSAKIHNEGAGGGAASSAAASACLLRRGCLTTFELELLPTDPDWDLPAVRVVGQLMPVAEDLFLPSLGVHMAARLPQRLRAALEASMADQLAAEASVAVAAAAEAVKETASAAAAEEAVEAPEGTVLLPLGALRNTFRNIENYAGAIARAASEVERHGRDVERHGGGRGGSGSGDDGSDFSEGDDDGGLYDDDGYGDGSHRRERGAAEPARTQGGNDSASGDSDYSGDSGGEGEEGPHDEVRFSGGAAASGGGEGRDAPAAFAVVFEGLQLDNLAVVEALRASFEIACARCGTRATAVVASGAVAGGGGGGQHAAASGSCARCTAPWCLTMRPHFLHATSNSLCVVKPQGCRPMDLLPSMMAGQCSECNAVMSLRDVQVGLPFTRTCSSCHKELLLSVAAVSFVPRGPPRGGATAGGAASGAAAARRRHRADAGGGGAGGGAGGGVLRQGQPLPGLGTCKHYRHSYRWLRFPCCGMRFACDLCHEEAVPDGHAVRWAQRMVCGFCSTEQPVDLACRACGRRLAGSAANPSGRRTRFWEGGTGCRDPRRLDRNDPHKWKGRNKTVSAKASRVGPKPWSGKAVGGGGGS